MHRSLTVWEVLYYNTVLRLPPPSDPKKYEIIVKQVRMAECLVLHLVSVAFQNKATRIHACVAYFLYKTRRGYRPGWSMSATAAYTKQSFIKSYINF